MFFLHGQKPNFDSHSKVATDYLKYAAEMTTNGLYLNNLAWKNAMSTKDFRVNLFPNHNQTQMTNGNLVGK